MYKNLKRILIITPLIVSVFACTSPNNPNSTNTGSEANTIATTDADPSVMSIPSFSNRELTDFCTSYKSHINELIIVLRKKEVATIKPAYQNYILNFDQLSNMIRKARTTSPEELEKLNIFLRQTRPFVNEIVQSPYTSELSTQHQNELSK